MTIPILALLLSGLLSQAPGAAPVTQPPVETVKPKPLPSLSEVLVLKLEKITLQAQLAGKEVEDSPIVKAYRKVMSDLSAQETALIADFEKVHLGFTIDRTTNKAMVKPEKKAEHR